MDFLKAAWLELYPLLCMFVPCIVYQIIALRICSNRKPSIKYFVWTYIFLLYISLVLNVTGIGSVWDIGKYESVIRMEEIHLIPFQSGGFMTYMLNMIMFMPLGFLLPLLWDEYKNLGKTVLTGVLFSLAIEVGQLFNRRATDIDDLLMNTLGTAMGYGIWIIFKRVFQSQKETEFLLKKEALIYIGLAVLGRFFLHNWRFFVKLFYS